jgi:hypothetical protein
MLQQVIDTAVKVVKEPREHVLQECPTGHANACWRNALERHASRPTRTGEQKVFAVMKVSI